MKNKKRTLLCVLLATIFLMPLIGNTAVAGTTDYYFSRYDLMIKWPTNPGYMVDGKYGTYASTSGDGGVQLIYGPFTTGSVPQTITKVEIRAKGYYTGGQQGNISLCPIFRSGPGDYHLFVLPQNTGDNSSWFDITTDTNAPSPWTVADVDNLQCEVIAKIGDPAGPTCTVYCARVDIRVTWT